MDEKAQSERKSFGEFACMVLSPEYHEKNLSKLRKLMQYHKDMKRRQELSEPQC
jgi:hypothetical protein